MGAMGLLDEIAEEDKDEQREDTEVSESSDDSAQDDKYNPLNKNKEGTVVSKKGMLQTMVE